MKAIWTTVAGAAPVPGPVKKNETRPFANREVAKGGAAGHFL